MILKGQRICTEVRKYSYKIRNKHRELFLYIFTNNWYNITNNSAFCHVTVDDTSKVYKLRKENRVCLNLSNWHRVH